MKKVPYPSNALSDEHATVELGGGTSTESTTESPDDDRKRLGGGLRQRWTEYVQMQAIFRVCSPVMKEIILRICG